MDTRPGETKRRSTSLRRSLSTSQSTILNSTFNLNGDHVQGQPLTSPATLAGIHQQQAINKSINLPGGTALLTVVPKSPGNNGYTLLRSPSASLVPRRAMNSTPVSRRSSISSPEPWSNCASGSSSGIGSTTGGESSSPSTVSGHSSRASNHSTTTTTTTAAVTNNYSPDIRKQTLPRKAYIVNRRSSLSGASISPASSSSSSPPSNYANTSRIPGMNDITRTSSFTSTPQSNGKLMKRRSLDSSRNLMNRSFIALNQSPNSMLNSQCSPSLSSSTRSLIPTPVSNRSRYINYLASSQHISNNSNSNSAGGGINSNSTKATCVKDLINGNSVLTNTNAYNEANNLLSSMPKRTTVN